ncbi:anhydro-N-acetylmuramic acid kinase [Sphingomonas naphthae]|uniref:Anhydro-N-acetylmuramic acid kinase n=1 Tax=Sphingomonas naphthae TaxID=1813468 RepID=A0ABY7TSV9_9SPHN|nr:anhydro-N-acetylmuramic acid kinase [Sphingomonas naphthae]WCT75490.1 anhydro-N-acetylmuramic acid kinase [Sphingomonas naphthae]
MLAVGLMSGTSRDGIDAALIETDGQAAIRAIDFVSEPYPQNFRDRLAAACDVAMAMAAPGADPLIDAVTAELTDRHAAIVARLLAGRGADVIGFHGHTIAHRPDRGWTWQIGDGAALAQATGIRVVADLRSADVAAGGQGAPLLPVYHAALTAALPRPVAILNLGGVGNVTWIGEGDAIIACDTGPANALVDDWVAAETGARYDEGGALAATGMIDRTVLTAMLDNPWFDQPAPKSLDRADFTLSPARGLASADGAATLTAFSAEAVALALRLMPAAAKRMIVAGGGRHNGTLMRMIGEATGIVPEPMEVLGWDGDAIEAQGFAYMAVRSLMGLPISFPGTTGAPRPLCGGVAHSPG